MPKLANRWILKNMEDEIQEKIMQRRVYSREYYHKNKERFKGYYQKNKENLNLKKREYYQENKERLKLKAREYRRENKESVKEYRKVYVKREHVKKYRRELKLAYRARKKLEKLQAIDSSTNFQACLDQ